MVLWTSLNVKLWYDKGKLLLYRTSRFRFADLITAYIFVSSFNLLKLSKIANGQKIDSLRMALYCCWGSLSEREFQYK
jgi:hypothetical protein